LYNCLIEELNGLFKQANNIEEKRNEIILEQQVEDFLRDVAVSKS